jgi:hypothetical protein
MNTLSDFDIRYMVIGVFAWEDYPNDYEDWSYDKKFIVFDIETKEHAEKLKEDYIEKCMNKSYYINEPKARRRKFDAQIIAYIPNISDDIYKFEEIIDNSIEKEGDVLND